MKGILVIVPCGQGKIWDRKSQAGPTPARDAYTGAPFKVNREYAELFAEKWVILSAKYGFIFPNFMIPATYNVTFKKRSTNPVQVITLRRQVSDLGLDGFDQVIALGGKEYRTVVREAFASKPVTIITPFAGLPIGRMMQATKRAIQLGTLWT